MRLIRDDDRIDPGETKLVGIAKGYLRRMERRVTGIADPLLPNPLSDSQYYEVTLHHLVCAVMLGIVTRDANLLVLSPRKKGRDVCRQRSL